LGVLVVVFLLAGAVVGVGAAILTTNDDNSEHELFCYAGGYIGADGRAWQRGEGCRWLDADGNVIPGQPDPRCITAKEIVVSCDDEDATQQVSEDAVLGERG
jgi:hypothetical protein